MKVALDLIVWNGTAWQTAAVEAGLTTQAVRKALAKPHVQRYLRTEREVFRESARAQNIHAAVEVRDTAKNPMAKIQAAKFIESLDGGAVQREGQRAVAPGVVITVNVDRGSAQVDETIIEVNPAAATDIASAEDDQ